MVNKQTAAVRLYRRARRRIDGWGRPPSKKKRAWRAALICRPTAPRFRLGHHHVTLDQGEASYGISAPLGWAVVAATENGCIFPSRTMVLCTLDPIGSSGGPTRVRTVSLEGPAGPKTLGRTVATVRSFLLDPVLLSKSRVLL